MARRSLLNDADRKRLFGVPDDEASSIRLYSLSVEDRDFILTKRGARNQLGMAVQLGLLRYPGFGLRLDEDAQLSLVQFLAQQIEMLWPVAPDDLLQHVAPLGWNHINLTGDYLWTQLDTPEDDFRPLNIFDEAA
jgi:hypothetical protein